MNIMNPFLVRARKFSEGPPLEAEDHIARLHHHIASFFYDMRYVLAGDYADAVLAVFQP